MEANKRLEQLRTKLGDSYSGVQVWFFIYGLILYLVLGALILVVVTELFLGGEDPGGWALGLTMVGALVLTIVIAVTIERAWWRRYRYVWRHLKYTSLATLVIDEAAWNEVVAQVKSNPALSATGLASPRKLDELLELSADYWRYVLAVSRSEDELTRRRMLAWDNGTRVYNNLIHSLCNGCAAYVILVVLASLLVVGFPILYVGLYFYIQQHAAKSAFVDYFLDKPRTSRKKLKPL